MPSDSRATADCLTEPRFRAVMDAVKHALVQRRRAPGAVGKGCDDESGKPLPASHGRARRRWAGRCDGCRDADGALVQELCWPEVSRGGINAVG